MHPSRRFHEVSNKITQYILLGYQAVAVIVFIAGLYFSYGWLKNPFIGGFFEHTLILNGSDSREAGQQWELYAQGFQVGDQLLSVDGKPITNSNDLNNVMASSSVGQTVAVEIRTTSGEIQTANVSLQSFSSADRVAYYILPAFLGLVFLVVSLLIFGLRHSDSAGQAFSLLTSSLAIVIGSLFELYTSHHLTYLWTFAIGITGGAFIDLALGFPQEVRFVVGRPYLRWIGYLVGSIISLSAFWTLFNFDDPTAYIQAWATIYKFTGVSALFYFGSLLYHAITSYSPVVKSQARTILIGSVVAFGPTFIWILIVQRAFNPYFLLPTIIFPIASGYVILRFRILRTDYWMRQSLVYALLSVFIIAIYGLLVSGITLILAIPVPSDNPFLVGGFVVLIAIFLNPLRTRLQVWVDSIFFRGQHAYEDRLRIFSHELTQALDLNIIGHLLRQQIANSLEPDYIHIYTYNSLYDQYTALVGDDGHPTSDIRFESNSSLAQYFQKENIPVYLDSVNPFPTILKGDEARLSLLGVRLLVVLPGENRPVGWLALGTLLSGGLYLPKDLDFLDSLCNQASIAISRVQTVVALEQRVQEMKALTRVSQGVNVTLTYDDVFELIFAQTAQIIPLAYFHITLYNKAANYFYYGIRVDEDERITSFENQPLPLNLGLGQEIIRKGRPILTQDYMRECQTHNTIPSSQGIYAWMGVPLNSGTETMGALSVGSPDPMVTYTLAQLDLLQAIADQTAGAIVKTRLLQEAQQRAHQLATLNEITRQLTSTLEQESLLQNILENAVSILNCEGGTLLLMDSHTGDLEFRVTVGPVAGNLLGQKIPPGTGIVGRAVQTRAPVIENNAQRSIARYNIDTDKQTGFISRAVMAIPMQIKDRVLGVLEVVNRRDGLPFVEDDQSLLIAFADQAAVTIEKARAYEEVQSANIKLKELDKKKNEFLSIVSHELRTPLMPVQSCIQNLLAGDYGPVTDKQRSRLEIALANAREEGRLINNLLDLARIEEGKEQLKLEKANLNKIINDVATIFEYYIENRGVELINTISATDKLEMLMDTTKIKQVLTNLISNAFKFTPKGGQIILSQKVYQDKVEITVKDTGIGIPTEEQAKIFDRFYQVDTTLTRKVGGTGIGLNIAQTYVELHNGKIWVESVPETGSTFHFTLPV